ncbi:kinase-like protein [Xylaria arbuscula]|nr:kinase-like protein [Xylaria arbuscula]
MSLSSRRSSSGQSSQYSDSSSSLSRISSQSSQHSSSSDYEATESGLYDNLNSKLIQCDGTGETQNFFRFSFLPLDALEKVVTVETVKALSADQGWHSRHQRPSEIVTRARKVFAILGLFESTGLFPILFEEKLMDKHLPLARPKGVEQSKVLVSANGTKFNSSAKLKNRDLDDFLRCQYLVLAPVLASLGGGIKVDRDIHVDKDTPLPFFDVSKISSVHARSTVYKGILHAAHIEPRPSNNVEVAIKDYAEKEDFDKEKGNLTKIQGLNNPHLIQHIATIQQGNLYYVVFPWADGGNLSDFWKSHECNPQILQWSLQQMLGLADALFALHHKLGGHKLDGTHCRHGDLKPENILHFTNPRDGIYGTLVMADVGVSKIHHLATDLRHDGTNTKATTPCYEAPEAENNDKRPRRYDMWSLGCIFMEFIIWALDGYEAIGDFKKQRRGNDDPFPHKAAFYMRNGSQPAIVHPVVSKRLQILQNDSRCPPGSQLASLVNLIAQDLIVVDPEKRVKAGDLRDRLRRIVGQKTGNDPG